MNTAREMTPRINTQVVYEPIAGLQFTCLVADVKNAYGKTRLQITPVAGRGRAWVNASKCEDASSHKEVA